MSLLNIALIAVLLSCSSLYSQQATVTENLTIPFTADSGSVKIPASGPQQVDAPLILHFPANFPVDTQACLAALAQGAGICRADYVPVPVTVKYSPMNYSASPGESVRLSGQVILPLAIAQRGSKNGRFEYVKETVCPPNGSCSTVEGMNPISQSFLFPEPVTFATFILSAGRKQLGGKQAERLDFGTAHLSGILTVSVTVPASTKCAKDDKKYAVPALSQFDSRWASSCYNGFSGDCIDTVAPAPNPTGKHETIGDYGCNLTALAALLTTAGLPELPSSLNTFLEGHDDYSHRNVDIVGAIRSLRSIKQNKLNFVSLNDARRNLPSTSDDIADALDNGPLLAAVESRGKAQGHFLVITGRACQDDGTYQFSVMNPGHRSPDGTLTENAIVRGYVQDPPDLSLIHIAGSEAVELLLIGPDGKRVGYDPVSETVVDDIPLPDSVYDRDFVADPDTGDPISEISKFLTLHHPKPGPYILRIVGVSAGVYDLKVSVDSTDGSSQGDYKFNGVAAPGSSSTYRLAYSSNNDPVTSIVAVPGDTNGDGLVDCTDIAVVKASFGKRTGENGFAANADVNGDGVVDIRDLALVSQHLPTGTRCQ